MRDTPPEGAIIGEAEDRQEIERLRVLRATGLLEAARIPELDALCRLAQAQFGVATAMVTLIEEELQVIRAKAGTDLESTPRSVAFCDVTIRSDAVLVVPDARADPRFAANPLVTGPPFIRFYAGAPLVYLRQMRLGALCLIDPRPRDFSLGDRAELADMADEALTLIAREAARTVLPSRPR